MDTFIYICIQVPIIEEAIFRSMLPSLIMSVYGKFEYKDYIISILFGVVHIGNYYDIPTTIPKNIKILMIMSQCLITTILGFYNSQIDIEYALLFHSVFNLSALSCSIWITNLRPNSGIVTK